MPLSKQLRSSEAQVVVSIGPLDQMEWTAEVNGRDPRPVAQRKKTMGGGAGGQIGEVES